MRYRDSRLLLLILLGMLLSACSHSGTTQPSESTNAGSLSMKSTSSNHQSGAGTPASPSTGSSSQSENAGDHKSKTIRIGFVMDTLVEERWKKDRELFRQAAEQRGAEVIIQSADGDDARQMVQAEKMIQQGIDVLVIVPHNAEAAAALIQKAHHAGIKVLSYDRLVKNADVDLYVSFDNEEVGRLQARAIIKQVPKGKYVYIGGANTDNNAHLFKKGVFDILQPLIERGDIQVVYDQWSKDWQPAYAKANMQQALQANRNRVDAVIVANDATAGGAIEALAEKGMAGQIPVAGQDGDLAAARRIIKGTQTMTVYKPLQQLAGTTADMAIRLARGEKIDTRQKVNNGKTEVPAVLLQPIAVDASNLDQTMIRDHFHSREEIYGPVQ
nr:D-xylose ABC transporter substrate-binding protein [Paenibacillus bovis]